MIRRGDRAERDRQVRAGKADEQAAKRERKTRLKRASKVCEADRAKTTRKCAARRKRIRAAARDAIERAKQYRRDARAAYSEKHGTGAIKRSRRKRYSKAESDSLAMHSIPAELHEIWKRERAQFSYDLPPDARAEAFQQWAEQHPADVEDQMVELYEATYTDDYWAEQERLAHARASA